MAGDSQRRKQTKSDVSLDTLGLEMGNKPPQALDVEEAVLSALLVEPNCVEEVMLELSQSPECFYSEQNRMVFEAMKALSESHTSIDILTVSQQLRADGNLDAVGGTGRLASLSQQIGAAAHIEFYIKILKQKCIQRDLITASYRILKDSYNDSINVDDLIDTAQSQIFAAVKDSVKSDSQSIRSVIDQVIRDLEKMQDSTGLSGVPSGFTSLDRKTYGWQPGDLIIIAARPSVGKTAFVLNVARNAAIDHKKPVAIFTLEMPASRLVQRMMITETGLSADKIKGAVKLEEHEWVQLETKIKNLLEAPIYIDETSSLSVMDFRSRARRLVKDMQVKLLIVDYMQLMQGPAELRGFREQEVAAISRTLKSVAKELNVPVIALSQLSRKAVDRQGSNARPLLSDLRESGSIEQDADMVLFLHRYDYQGLAERSEEEGKTDLIIAKNRNGETGDVHLRFRGSEVRFVDEEDTLVGYANSQPPEDPGTGRVSISQLGGMMSPPMSGNTGFDI